MSSSTIEADLVVRAARAVVTEQRLSVTLVDGRMIVVPLEWFPRLVHGNPIEQASVEIGPFGLHWPDLDEDISIRSLLLGHRSGESVGSLRQWLEYRARGEKVPVQEYPLDNDII